MTTEELLGGGRQEGIRIGEQRGLQRGREVLLALAEHLPGPEAADALAEKRILEVLRWRLARLLQPR